VNRATIRRLVLVLAAGAFCASAAWAPAQATQDAPPPGLGVRLLQGPAGSEGNPRAHEYIVDDLEPGTTISRQIGFSNGDAEPKDLTFYAVAADLADGGFVPGAGHAANELTSWTSFSPTSATVQPGQQVAVTVTIAVPADATTGERYAAALAEHAAPPATAGGRVTSVSRVGIRMYLSVSNGGARIAFDIDTITAHRAHDGYPFVTAEVHNTGQRAVDLTGTLELNEGPSSLSAGPFPATSVSTLAPGQYGTVTVGLSEALPVGPWNARLTLTSGRTTVTAIGAITFPADADKSGVSATAPPSLALVREPHTNRSPVLLAGLTVTVLGLALVLVTGLRRRRTAL
jgi:hypothetical protein